MKRRVKQLIVPGLVLTAIYVAIFGGEYSLFELRSARASVESERVNLADLHRQIDSLDAWADSLQVDPATIERIARERYGMIREGETLYRFVADEAVTVADSVPARGPSSPSRPRGRETTREFLCRRGVAPAPWPTCLPHETR